MLSQTPPLEFFGCTPDCDVIKFDQKSQLTVNKDVKKDFLYLFLLQRKVFPILQHKVVFSTDDRFGFLSIQVSEPGPPAFLSLQPACLYSLQQIMGIISKKKWV